MTISRRLRHKYISIGLIVCWSTAVALAQIQSPTPDESDTDETVPTAEIESSSQEDEETVEGGEPTAQDFYERAQHEADAGNLGDAIADSNRAVELEPKNIAFL